MVRGLGRLDVQRVRVPDLERAVRSQGAIRVGATIDPLARARQYERDGANGRLFVGTMLYCAAANTRAAEERLIAIARRCGGAPLNIQDTSNYHEGPGYVYVVLGRPGRVPPPPPALPAHRRQAGRPRGGQRPPPRPTRRAPSIFDLLFG